VGVSHPYGELIKAKKRGLYIFKKCAVADATARPEHKVRRYLMGRNSEIAGIALVLLAVSALGGGNSGFGAGNSTAGSRLPITKPDLGSLAGEFHRMVGLMERVDSLGQMAVNPPRLPEPSQLINTSALPDISALMDLAGPLLNNFKGEK
jgi:hypothetical protein